MVLIWYAFLVKIRKPILNIKNLKETTLVDLLVIDLNEAIIKKGSLDNRNIDEIKISESTLRGISLRSSRVEEIKIVDSCLDDMDFVGATFNKTYFERVTINKSRLQGTQLMEFVACDVVIDKSKCTDVSFRFAKIKNTIFLDCNLDNADFIGANLENVIFRNCSLKNSQFSQSRLKNVNFKDSNIEGIAISRDSFGNITVNTGQAIYLASLLGLNIED